LQPEEPIKEDFLFPMSHRLSYASSPESDYEGYYGRAHSLYSDRDGGDGTDGDGTLPRGRPRLPRASSDPSLATQDNVPGIPPYPAPPIYNRGYLQVRERSKSRIDVGIVSVRNSCGKVTSPQGKDLEKVACLASK
jgi:tight junction protein 1